CNSLLPPPSSLSRPSHKHPTTVSTRPSSLVRTAGPLSPSRPVPTGLPPSSQARDTARPSSQATTGSHPPPQAAATATPSTRPKAASRPPPSPPPPPAAFRPSSLGKAAAPEVTTARRFRFTPTKTASPTEAAAARRLTTTTADTTSPRPLAPRLLQPAARQHRRTATPRRAATLPRPRPAGRTARAPPRTLPRTRTPRTTRTSSIRLRRGTASPRRASWLPRSALRLSSCK
ncbi:hypothetical protein DFJ73DRAFT_897762, partial [Zopfochytrium polystomum]